jgi:hypothetical protein
MGRRKENIMFLLLCVVDLLPQTRFLRTGPHDPMLRFGAHLVTGDRPVITRSIEIS